MCCPKVEGGMGFRDMAHFSISLLAKQGWRIINNQNSLVTQVFKAKYFPNDHFLNSRLGNSSSYVWRSIWAAKGVLEKGLCWRDGTGLNICINHDAWILEAPNFRLSTVVNTMSDSKVFDLIDSSNRLWKNELIHNTFSEEDAARILRIPLAQTPHDDFLTWGAESSGEFSVRSDYKLLQDYYEIPRAYALKTYRNFYKKTLTP